MGMGEKDDEDYFGTFTEEEALRLGVARLETIEGEDCGTPPEEELGKSKSARAKVAKV